MKKRMNSLLVMMAVLGMKNAWATNFLKKEVSCFPLSDVTYVAGNKSISGLSETEVDLLLASVQTIMGPEVERRLNKKLIIQKLWGEANVDAYATRDDDNNAVIVISGGLARHPLMTKDAFLLLMCHEIGHHLGGAPRILRGQTGLRGWSSAEGQADYYAASKCLPLFYKSAHETKSSDIDESSTDYSMALSKCQDNICARVTMAGLVASRVFASLTSGMSVPKLTLTDATKVATTIYRHPNPQCRLDTYLAGANCDLGPDIPFDVNNPKIGACSMEKNLRPACWFQEKDF